MTESIENIFSSKVATKILLHIGRRPYKEFYLNEISKELKIGLGRTNTLLEDFTKYKILIKRRSGNRLLYKLNENSGLSIKIIELANLDAFLKLPEVYRTAVSKFLKEYENIIGENLVSIVIFGSVAKGTANRWSDIDILVIIKGKAVKGLEDKLHEVFSKIMEIFSRVPEEHMYTQAEFQEEYNIGNDFLVNIMSDGIVVYDRDFFNRFLIKGIPTVTRKTIENKLKFARNWLDSAVEVYKRQPSLVAPQLGVISIHISRALLLLSSILPSSKHDIPKQLEGIGEFKFSKIYKKTREWWENPPLDVDKEEVWRIINFLKEKHMECSRKLEGWS